jgi:hypothetical protein
MVVVVVEVVVEVVVVCVDEGVVVVGVVLVPGIAHTDLCENRFELQKN